MGMPEQAWIGHRCRLHRLPQLYARVVQLESHCVDEQLHESGRIRELASLSHSLQHRVQSSL
jgi:hypothetical protein